MLNARSVSEKSLNNVSLFWLIHDAILALMTCSRLTNYNIHLRLKVLPCIVFVLVESISQRRYVSLLPKKFNNKSLLIFYFTILINNKQYLLSYYTDSVPKQVQITPQENAVNIRNLCGKRNIRQLIRVTPMGSGNPRSILLPVSLKDMKEVRTIKIMTTQAKNLKGFKINQANIINKPIQVYYICNVISKKKTFDKESWRLIYACI